MGITLLVTERAPKVFSSSILIRDTLNINLENEFKKKTFTWTSCMFFEPRFEAINVKFVATFW